MGIVGVSARPHYADHLSSILEALGAPTVKPDEVAPGDLAIVASYYDVRSLPAGVPNVYVEHGAGQTYQSYRGLMSASYSGSTHPDYASTVLFLCPNEVVANRWRAAWPNALAAVVGCPKLDRWGPNGQNCHVNQNLIAWTWHWDGTFCPEMRSALLYYAHHLQKVADRLRSDGWDLVGHAHPRQPYHWESTDIPYEPDSDVILDTAGVLIADNTSFAYEMSALGRPTVALNAPYYRRNVHHGLRFWDLPPGPMVDHWYEIPDAVRRAVTENLASAAPSPGRQVFGVLDGKSTERAVTEIRAVAERLNTL